MDPPEYHETRPRHGVTRMGEDKRPTAETLQLQLNDVQSQLKKISKRDDTGVHRINTESLQVTLRGDLASLVRKWALAILALLGVPVGVLGVRVWSVPTDAPTQESVKSAVKETVEEQGNELEVQVKKNQETARQARKEVRLLGREFLHRDDERAQQLDHITKILITTNPRAQRIEPPPAVKKRQQRLAEEDDNRRVEELFAEEDFEEDAKK